METEDQGQVREQDDAVGSAELLALLRRLSWSQFGLYLALGRTLGMGSNDVWALERLGMEGPLGPVELGKRLGGMRSASATALVDRLEAAGHVERRRHPSDRRRLVVVPTERAYKAGSEAIAPLGDSLEKVASELTDEERAVVARYLDRVVETINSFNESHDAR